MWWKVRDRFFITVQILTAGTGIEVPIVSISPTSPQVEEVTGYLPTPVPSSRGTSPAPSNSEPQSDFDVLSNASRERRVRKSVNYAEPKLNT